MKENLKYGGIILLILIIVATIAYYIGDYIDPNTYVFAKILFGVSFIALFIACFYGLYKIASKITDPKVKK